MITPLCCASLLPSSGAMRRNLKNGRKEGSYRIHSSSHRRLREKSQGLTNEILRPFDGLGAQNRLCEFSVLHLVILRATKDLGPAQPGHACPERNRRGSARCFALLSMTIMLASIPLALACHTQTLNGTLQDSSVQNQESCRVRILHSA